VAKKKEEIKAVEEKEVAAAIETAEVAEVKEEIQNAKLQKKRENREAKAERKAKNQVKEEQKRPSNKVLAIMIFGVLLIMFVFVGGYNMSKKEASIQSYIKNNGGKDAYSNMMIDEETILNVTAKKNNMKVVFKVTTDDAKAAKETYDGEHQEEFVKYVAAYYLNDIKPQTRAIFAKADCVIKINGKEYKTYTVRYGKADKIIDEYTNGEHDHEHEEETEE